jgi:hypothetical protein
MNTTRPSRYVIPAEAGIHFRCLQQGKMDSRFCGNDDTL